MIKNEVLVTLVCHELNLIVCNLLLGVCFPFVSTTRWGVYIWEWDGLAAVN
jgi:hypothetical protein